MDQELSTLLHRRQADASCLFTRWRHFSEGNDVMPAILRMWRQIKHLTPSIDAYLLEVDSCQISSRSDLKRWRPGLYCRGRPNKNNKMSIAIWDQFLI